MEWPGTEVDGGKATDAESSTEDVIENGEPPLKAQKEACE